MDVTLTTAYHANNMSGAGTRRTVIAAEDVLRHGTEGHRYADLIEGKNQRRRIDYRVRAENRNRRSNVTPRVGKRRYLLPGSSQKGTTYAAILKCTECRAWKLRREFYNMAVSAEIRQHNGCNVRCRDCQVNEYSGGYKVDDFVQVSKPQCAAETDSEWDGDSEADTDEEVSSEEEEESAEETSDEESD